MANNTEKVKFVGGSVPIELYWQFTSARADRKETANEALKIALTLYIKALEEK